MPALLGDDEVARHPYQSGRAGLLGWGHQGLRPAESPVRDEVHRIQSVEGRSNRKYTDEDAVAKAVEDAGYDPYEKRLLGITRHEPGPWPKKFEELLGGLVYKPPGKPRTCAGER